MWFLSFKIHTLKVKIQIDQTSKRPVMTDDRRLWDFGKPTHFQAPKMFETLNSFLILNLWIFDKLLDANWYFKVRYQIANVVFIHSGLIRGSQKHIYACTCTVRCTCTVGTNSRKMVSLHSSAMIHAMHCTDFSVNEIYPLLLLQQKVKFLTSVSHSVRPNRV